MGPTLFWEIKAASFRNIGKLSALRTGRLYPQEHSGTHFKRMSRLRAHGIVGCDGKKKPADTTGIDSRTFRLVAQCLNHYGSALTTTAVP
jgi:hypothetical protein